MIMSGLYEASLDRKIITSILAGLKTDRKQMEKAEEECEEGEDPKSKIDLNLQSTLFYKRIHQLYAVLVGNLKLPSEDGPEKSRTVWKDVNNLVKAPERLPLVHEHTDPESSKSVEPKSEEQPNPKADDQMAPKSDYRTITDTRLKGMLNCQASFGAAVGAPVVFFVGSFLFGVISNLTVVGDNDTAHALAFGQWWMTIPHVAIVSGCLLAGNNPNTLEIIVSSLTKGPWEKTDMPKNEGFRKFYHPYYSSVYLPVEMWARGHNKRDWVDRVLERYEPPPTQPTLRGVETMQAGPKKESFT
jgi:hypothetical protein